jgi:hypothetical protein
MLERPLKLKVPNGFKEGAVQECGKAAEDKQAT